MGCRWSGRGGFGTPFASALPARIWYRCSPREAGHPARLYLFGSASGVAGAGTDAAGSVPGHEWWNGAAAVSASGGMD